MSHEKLLIFTIIANKYMNKKLLFMKTDPKQEKKNFLDHLGALNQGEKKNPNLKYMQKIKQKKKMV